MSVLFRSSFNCRSTTDVAELRICAATGFQIHAGPMRQLHKRGSGPSSPVDGQPALRAENPSANGFRTRTPEMKIWKEEIFGPVLSVVRARDYDAAVKLVTRTPTPMALPSLRATVMPRVTTRTRSRSEWSGSTFRSPCRWRSTALAAGSPPCSGTITCMGPRASASTHG